MTSRQKTVLKRWIISVVVLSRLAFWLVSLLPKELSSFLPNLIWLNMQISISSRTVPIIITHQFLDPIILGIIIYLVGSFYVACSKFGKMMTILILPAMLTYLAYVFFYLLDGSRLTIFMLRQLPLLGSLFLWLAMFVAACTVLRFMLKGAIRFFEEDRQKNQE